MAYKVLKYSTDKANVLPSGKAAEAISAGELVYLNSSGTYNLADSVAVGGTRKDALGVAVTDALENEQVSAVRSAHFKGWTGLTIGGKAYLSATAGAITQTAPTATVAQIVGYAKSATEYVINVASVDAGLNQQDHVDDPAAAAALTQNTLTDNGGGTADQTVEDVADIALSTSDTYTDAAVNGAVNTAIASISNNFKEMTTELALIKTDVAAVRTAVVANNTAIDSILVVLETIGATASA